MKSVIFFTIMILNGFALMAQTISYTYDKLGHLTQAAYPDSSIIKYAYDPSGNRISVTVKDVFYHAPQTLQFNPVVNVVYGISDFTPGAFSNNSTIPIIYSSADPSIANITGAGKIHISGVGSVIITANQAGNNAYLPADPVSQTLIVSPATLAIKADDQVRTYRSPDQPFTFTYTGLAYNDDPTKFASMPVGVTAATINSNVGTYPITVSGAANPNYIINYIPGLLMIIPATRIFLFKPLPMQTFNDPDFAPGASVDSGEPITYSSSDQTVATIVNNKIHIVGAGTTDITATVPDNLNYTTTNPLTQTLTVSKASQEILFDPIPTQLKNASPLVLQCVASSGLPVIFTSSDPSIATIIGNTVKFLTLGTAIITATQGGDRNYLAAKSMSQPLKIDGTDGSLILVHRIISPNGDGINDVLQIEGIKDYPNNHVIIVDRNGIKVFEARNYDNQAIVFDGHSNAGVMLPQGTYFFKLEYQVNGEKLQKTDYFVLKL